MTLTWEITCKINQSEKGGSETSTRADYTQLTMTGCKIKIPYSDKSDKYKPFLSFVVPFFKVVKIACKFIQKLKQYYLFFSFPVVTVFEDYFYLYFRVEMQ